MAKCFAEEFGFLFDGVYDARLVYLSLPRCSGTSIEFLITGDEIWWSPTFLNWSCLQAWLWRSAFFCGTMLCCNFYSSCIILSLSSSSSPFFLVPFIILRSRASCYWPGPSSEGELPLGASQVWSVFISLILTLFFSIFWLDRCYCQVSSLAAGPPSAALANEADWLPDLLPWLRSGSPLRCILSNIRFIIDLFV